MNRGADFTVELWEAKDGYVVCFKGEPVGQALPKVDAVRVAKWLGTALDGLLEVESETKA